MIFVGSGMIYCCYCCRERPGGDVRVARRPGPAAVAFRAVVLQQGRHGRAGHAPEVGSQQALHVRYWELRTGKERGRDRPAEVG